jgi:hypothetical protein
MADFVALEGGVQLHQVGGDDDAQAGGNPVLALSNPADALPAEQLPAEPERGVGGGKPA